MPIQLPQRFQGINEDEEVDTAETVVDGVLQERSLYGMIAQASDLDSFNQRWQQGSDSDEEQAQTPTSEQPTVVPSPRASSAKGHRKKLSESRLLKTFMKPDRRESQDLMTHSQILPPRERHDIPERAKDDIKLTAPVLGQRLRAQARAAGAEQGGTSQSARSSQESLTSKQRPAALANVLAEIFHLDAPEDVIAEFPCWYLQSNLLQGYMYITSKHICFYAYLQKKTGVVLKSGYITKRGKQNPRYSRYWFVLKGTNLTYYSNAAQPYFPSGNIDLRYGISAEVVIDKDEPERAGFTITTDTRTFQLRADSLASAQEWIKQVQKVIFRSHNDGDSVKVSLPLDNVVDAQLSPMIGATDTIRFKVMDNGTSQSIDEYFFTFFSSGSEAYDIIHTLTTDNAAKSVTDARTDKLTEQVKTTMLHTSSERRPGMTRGRSSFERTRQSRPDDVYSEDVIRPASSTQNVDLSASQILTGDLAFQEPTLRPDSPRTTTESPLRTSAESSRRHEPQQRPAVGTRPAPSSIQGGRGIAGYVREQSNRLSSYLSASPREYYEKFSGALAGGRRHYAEAEGSAPEDRINDPEDDLEVAEHERRFREHFALPDSESLLAVYYASLHRVLPLYGKIYLGTRFLCFRSLLYGTKTKIVIPLQDIDNVDKEKGFRLGYPGMVLVLRGHEELFLDFRNAGLRDDCVVTILRTLDQRHREHIQDSHEDLGELAAAENRLLEQMRQKDDTPSMDDSYGDQSVLFDETTASMLDFKPKTSLRIACLTIGSRGDVQPYIALCKGLLAEGHRPLIATHIEFGDWVKSHGIDFTPVGGNPAELMRLCVELGMFTPKFIYETNYKFRGWLDELLDTAWQACQGCDVLIESPSAMAGIHIAEALGIPYFRAFTMMWTRTRAYPHAFAAMNHKMGGTYNLTTYGVFENIFWHLTASQINRWRMKTLGIGPTTSGKLQQNKVPFLYNFSPSFVVPPLDFSDWVRITGYWFLDEGEQYTPPADLLAFIEKARADKMKLVYIGFGSIVVSDSKALTQSVVDAVVKADVRCILSKGWSDRLDTQSTEPDAGLPPCIYKIGSAPHDWLFKQVDAAVHHGGAGTTGASLRAGVPTVIKPFFGDQFFSAIRVEDLGVGLRIDHISQNVLGKALWIATHDDRMRTKARLLGERIRAEDGVGTAIKAIYRDLEYATTLIKRKNSKAVTPGDVSGDDEQEESWTFVDAADEADNMILSGSEDDNETSDIVYGQKRPSRYGVYQLGSLIARNRLA